MTTVTSTIAQALGVPMPSPSSFKVNGVTINVDLSQDSLSSIVAKINAATSTHRGEACSRRPSTAPRRVVSS